MTETKFETLTAFLSAWFDRPTDELPVEVLARINQDFDPMPWDLLNAGQRRSVAAQWDAQHDPAYEDERAREWDLACRLQAVKGDIAKWLLMNPKSITEAEIQESKLKPLREQAAQLEAELDALAEDDQSQETAPATESTREADANVEPWIQRAREYAKDIWLRMLDCNKRPSKEGIAREIAARLHRDDKMVTKRGARITDEYILRHALSPTKNGGWQPPVSD